jgi:hypothetical protein
VEEEKIKKMIRALELAKDIIGYVGFDEWERECLRDSLREFDSLTDELEVVDINNEEDVPEEEKETIIKMTENIIIRKEGERKSKKGIVEYSKSPEFDSDEFKEYISSFRWRTAEGEVYNLSQMKTSHIFNSLKMVYNHVAVAYGKPPIWFVHEYREYHESSATKPEQMLKICLAFVYTIEHRGDLPFKYVEPYSHILFYLLGINSSYNKLVSKPQLSDKEKKMVGELLERGLVDNE